MTDYTLPKSGFAEDPGGPPATLGEVWDAAFEAQRDIANPQSRLIVLEQEYDKRIDAVFKATGVRLSNPRRDPPTEDDWRELVADEGVGADATGRTSDAMAVAERRFHRELDRLGEQYPDKADALQGGRTVWDTAYERVRKAEAASEATIRRSRTAVDLPLLGPVDPVALTASFWGWAHDPVNIATSVIGPGGSAARGILWNAARQGAAGAGQQALVEPFTQQWRAEAGLDFGWGQAAQNIAFAGLAGGALDAGGRAAYRAARGRPLGGTAPAATPGSESGGPVPVSGDPEAAGQPVPAPRESGPRVDPDTALEAAARRLPEDHPVRRAAEGDAAASIDLVERMGMAADDPAVRDALSQLRFETLQEASVADALALAEEASGMAARLRAYDLDGDVARAAAHVASPETSPPSHPTIVAEPVAPSRAADDPLAVALASGDVEPLQAVQLLRAEPELAALLPPTTEMARGVHALARLSDAGFDRVVDGRIDPAFAAIVADALPATRHGDALDVLAAARPRDMDHARRIVAEMSHRPTDVATARLLLAADPEGADLATGGAARPERSAAPEFVEPAGDGARLQTESLAGLETRALDAVTGAGPAETWMRDLTDALAAADRTADEGLLVAACKIS
jgi:hypothetical protein